MTSTNLNNHAADDAPLIFVVDDDQSICSMLCYILMPHYRVMTANSGLEALEMIRTMPHPDDIQLILCDQHMPFMSGAAFLEKSRSIIPAAIRIIFTASREFDDVIVAINQAQIYSFILKPFSKNELLLTIERALEAYNLRAQNLRLMRESQALNASLAVQIHEKTRELQEERDKAELYFEVAGVMMLVIDMNKKVQKINKKGLEVLNCTEADIIGKNWFETFVPDAVRARALLDFDALIAGVSSAMHDYECMVQTHTGKVRHIAWHNTAMVDARGRTIIGLFSGEDITNRHQAEEALRESEANYRDLVENSPDIIHSVNNQGRIISTNKKATELLGYSREELIGMSISQLYSPEETQSTSMRFQQLQSDGYRKQSMGTLIAKNGQRIAVEISSTAQYDSANNFIYSRTILRDVRDRLKADADLRESEANFRALIENVNDVFIRYDLDLRYRYVSPSIKSFINVRPEDLIGKKHSEVEFAKSHANFFDHSLSKAIISGKAVDVEFSMPGPDGQHYQQTRIYPEFDPNGTIKSVVTVTRDVTAQKRVDEERRINQERYQLLAELTSDYMFEISVDDNQNFEIKWLTENAFQKNTGYTWQEAKARGGWLGFVYPEDVEILRQRMKRLLQGEDDVSEYRIVTKNNQVRWWRDYGRPIPDAFDNKITRILGGGQDITERKLVEEALRMAKDAAETASRTKSAFLATMSHELRTPLSAILGYAQLLKQDAKILKSYEKHIRTILDSGEHLLMMINAILDISKIEAGKMETISDDFSTADFIKLIIEMIEVRARKKNLNFVYEASPNLPPAVHGDKTRLHQILLNLLGNAVKFTERGQITFKITYQQGHAGFWIEDTGIGIPADKIAAVFEPFSQINDRRFKSEGTGLGLSISQRLVRLMGSELYMHSVVEQGSKFWFEIALPEASGGLSAELHFARQIIGLRGDKRQLLVVDDNRTNRETLQAMLESLGFTVACAPGGQEAIILAKKIQPDLIMIDLIMPGLDGFETIKRLRQITTLPIIAFSADTFIETRQKSLLAGCNRFIPQPIRFDDLYDCLSRYLNVEWIYADSESPGPNSPNEQLVVPPAEWLRELIAFEKSGDIKRVYEWIVKIETADPQYAAFTLKVRQFAECYNLKELIQFISPYVN